MPTYQYACTACDERLEAVQSFTDAPLTTCPACEGALRKVFSAVGVVFKGSGFYKNDSRSSKSGDSKSDTKSDSKTPAETSSSSGANKTADAGSSSTPASTPAPAAPVSKSA